MSVTMSQVACLKITQQTTATVGAGAPPSSLPNVEHSREWFCASLDHGPIQILLARRNDLPDGSAYRETVKHQSLRPQRSKVATRPSVSDTLKTEALQVTAPYRSLGQHHELNASRATFCHVATRPAVARGFLRHISLFAPHLLHVF